MNMTIRGLQTFALFLCLESAGLCVAQGPGGPGARAAESSDSDVTSETSDSAVRTSAAGAPNLFSAVAGKADESAGKSAAPAPSKVKRVDFNSGVYYRNKVEFSLESGILAYDLPFVFDVFVGGDYSINPQSYTVVPVFPSVRWQMGDVHGPWILRGNTDMTFTLSVTPIPRGPETLYDAFDVGFRRNFVQRNWRVAPYFEVRVGAGFLNAQEPYGNAYAQGQNLTFTIMTGAGFRYNFNGRTSLAIGATYFHVSNAYLSEPKYDDNGINVVGPLIGFNVRLSKPRD
jgi:Lipid A 3-O-deacylase (PagL)